MSHVMYKLVKRRQLIIRQRRPSSSPAAENTTYVAGFASCSYFSAVTVSVLLLPPLYSYSQCTVCTFATTTVQLQLMYNMYCCYHHCTVTVNVQYILLLQPVVQLQLVYSAYCCYHHCTVTVSVQCVLLLPPLCSYSQCIMCTVATTTVQLQLVYNMYCCYHHYTVAVSVQCVLLLPPLHSCSQRAVCTVATTTAQFQLACSVQPTVATTSTARNFVLV